MAATKPKDIAELFEHRMLVSEAVQLSYFVSVDQGVTREQVLHPDFWRHVAIKLQPYTRINVTTDDGEYYLELLVISCGRNWAVVKELSHTKLQSDIDTSKLDESASMLQAKFMGGINKWCIINSNTDDVLKKGLQTKDEAISFIKEHAKAVTR
jgi:hypothetical protein